MTSWGCPIPFPYSTKGEGKIDSSRKNREKRKSGGEGKGWEGEKRFQIANSSNNTNVYPSVLWMTFMSQIGPYLLQRVWTDSRASKYFSCLCCAASIRSSILFISSTLCNQFGKNKHYQLLQSRGIQDLAAFNKCRTIDFLYCLAEIMEMCSRKNAGSSGILCSVKFWVTFRTTVQKGFRLGQDQNTLSSVPLSAWHRQQQSLVLGKHLCNTWGV